jgi:hypothetical protein
MTSEVRFPPFGLFSGGRRPALKPQRMEGAGPAPAESRRTMASVKATVTAPCASCAHQPVCDRLGSLERLAGQINVESAPLHAGLTVAISATIDCDAYLRARGSNTHARDAQVAAEPAGNAEAAETPSGRAKPQYSPETLQHLRDNAARNRAKLAEQRAAAKQLKTAD